MADRKLSKLHPDELADEDAISRCVNFVGLPVLTLDHTSIGRCTPLYARTLSDTHTRQIPKYTRVARVVGRIRLPVRRPFS